MIALPVCIANSDCLNELEDDEHSEQSGPTLKRTEGRAPVWVSEFNTKAATIQSSLV
jgi:hypothetical protein